MPFYFIANPDRRYFLVDDLKYLRADEGSIIIDEHGKITCIEDYGDIECCYQYAESELNRILKEFEQQSTNIRVVYLRPMGEIIMKTYNPNPVDTADVVLSEELLALTEKLAENTHDVWAKNRIEQGWQYGETRDDEKKLHPCLVPYDELPESEKEYDRNTAIETLKLITKLGYSIECGAK